MNKIYKVIWSKAKSCYIVVSELAKRVSRSSTATRAGRASLAAVMAAAALTAGTLSPSTVWASEYIENAVPGYYAAIGDADTGTNPFTVGVNGVTATTLSGNVLTVTMGGTTYTYNYTTVVGDYYNETTNSYEQKTFNYWVRDGFGVKPITERYHSDALNIKLDLYKLPGGNYNNIVAGGEHSATITDVKTAINNTNLDEFEYVHYAAITNTGTTAVDATHHFYIKQGEQYADAGNNTDNLNENFYVFKYDPAQPNSTTDEYNETTGKYMFNGKDVEYENIYKIDGKGIGVFLDKSVANIGTNNSAWVASQGAGVYDGAVYGLNNEILLSGYNNKTNKWSTVWAAEVTDPNATIESMTVGQFNEFMHHLHLEDVKLAEADIIGTRAVNATSSSAKISGVTFDQTSGEKGGAINLVNKISNQNPAFILKSSGGTGGQNTQISIHTPNYVQIQATGFDGSPLVDANGDPVWATDSEGNHLYTPERDTSGNVVYNSAADFTLDTGSKVEANTAPTTSTTLEDISINGVAYNITEVSATETNGNLATITIDGTTYNLAADTDTDLHIEAGTYSPDDTSHSITIDVLDKTNTDVGDVVLENIAQADDLTAVENRVTTVENKVTTLEGQVTTNTNNITDHETRIDEIENSYVQNITHNTTNNSLTITQTGTGGPITFTDTNTTNESLVGAWSATTPDQVTLTLTDSASNPVVGYIDNVAKASDLDDLADEVSNIDARVTTVEGKVTTIEGDITTIQSDITTIEGNITTIQSDITTIQGDITTIEGDISTIQSDITTIQGDITTINTTVSNIDNRVTSNTTEINNLKQNHVANIEKTGDHEWTVTQYDNSSTSSEVIIHDTTLVTSNNGLTFNDTNGKIAMTVTDTDRNSVTGEIDISGYVGDKIENEARNANVTVNNQDISIETAINNNYTDIQEVKNDYVTNITENGLDNNGNIINRNEHSWTITQVIDGTPQTVTVKDLNTTNKSLSSSWTGNDITLTLTDSDNVSINGTISDVAKASDMGDVTNLNTNIQNTTGDTTLVDAINNTYTEAKKHTTVEAGNNIVVTESTNNDGGKHYTVATAKDATFDSVTSTTVNATTVNVGNNITIEEGNVNMGGNKITNVHEGDVYQGSTDAVNGGQLWQTNQNVANLDNRVSNLGHRMNKVGAGAAALAALHPLDFDPDDKLSFAAGVGNYGGATAAAIGAFYRPNERVMFSIGGTTGNGENMVNAGVSFALGKGGKINNSRVAMTHEINDLRQQVAYLSAVVAQMAANSGYQFNGMKPFPDTPENHWAYEYVAKLAAEGIVEGYPDGNFLGEREMTRYEFAAMLFRALEKGFQLDTEIIDEFEPELGRLSVERIKGEQNHKNKIERVRVNDQDIDRDVYGGKINVGKTWP